MAAVGVVALRQIRPDAQNAALYEASRRSQALLCWPSISSVSFLCLPFGKFLNTVLVIRSSIPNRSRQQDNRRLISDPTADTAMRKTAQHDITLHPRTQKIGIKFSGATGAHVRLCSRYPTRSSRNRCRMYHSAKRWGHRVPLAEGRTAPRRAQWHGARRV